MTCDDRVDWEQPEKNSNVYKALDSGRSSSKETLFARSFVAIFVICSLFLLRCLGFIYSLKTVGHFRH